MENIETAKKLILMALDCTYFGDAYTPCIVCNPHPKSQRTEERALSLCHRISRHLNLIESMVVFDDWAVPQLTATVCHEHLSSQKFTERAVNFLYAPSVDMVKKRILEAITDRRWFTNCVICTTTGDRHTPHRLTRGEVLVEIERICQAVELNEDEERVFTNWAQPQLTPVYREEDHTHIDTQDWSKKAADFLHEKYRESLGSKRIRWIR